MTSCSSSVWARPSSTTAPAAPQEAQHHWCLDATVGTNHSAGLSAVLLRLQLQLLPAWLPSTGAKAVALEPQQRMGRGLAPLVSETTAQCP